MEGLKKEIYQWLIELGEVEAAGFLKACEVNDHYVDIAFNMSDDTETVINDVTIHIPLKQYKSLSDYVSLTDSIESALRECGQAQGVYARNIDWLPMLPSMKVQPVESQLVIDHDFINEQIGKCRYKINEGDYNGAVTNARSLIEAVCIEVIERIEKVDVENDGKIDNLWSRTKKAMKLDGNKASLPDTVFQILSGLDTAVKGLAGLSNNAGDRHANKFKTQKHHAKLAVNLSLAVADFLFDTLEFQQSTDATPFGGLI